MMPDNCKTWNDRLIWLATPILIISYPKMLDMKIVLILESPSYVLTVPMILLTGYRSYGHVRISKQTVAPHQIPDGRVHEVNVFEGKRSKI